MQSARAVDMEPARVEMYAELIADVRRLVKEADSIGIYRTQRLAELGARPTLEDLAEFRDDVAREVRSAKSVGLDGPLFAAGATVLGAAMLFLLYLIFTMPFWGHPPP